MVVALKKRKRVLPRPERQSDALTVESVRLEDGRDHFNRCRAVAGTAQRLTVLTDRGDEVPAGDEMVGDFFFEAGGWLWFANPSHSDRHPGALLLNREERAAGEKMRDGFLISAQIHDAFGAYDLDAETCG